MNDPNLRKAAVLLRSLDSDTAAVMLSQLSAAEAASLRAAIRDLGPIDPDEQADVAAEFQRTRPATPARSHDGVELDLSSSVDLANSGAPAISSPAVTSPKRFEFLASASVTALVRFLAREHAQTIAVVLAHLAPERAASVLAALPAKLQADTIERLSVLGDADTETVTALEQELVAWMATRTTDRGTLAQRRETVANILAATDAKTRHGIIQNLKGRNRPLAEELLPAGRDTSARPELPTIGRHYSSKQAVDTTASIKRELAAAKLPPRPSTFDPPTSMPLPAPVPALPRMAFDQVGRLDTPTLAALLREVDANVLAIALAGSGDELVDRICAQMPKRVGRAFRRELRRLGPMRLSDIEGAQRIVADAAMRHISRRRPTLASA